MAGDGPGQGAEDRASAPDLHGSAHARLRLHRPARLTARYRVVVRRRGRTEKASYRTPDEALAALEPRLRQLADEQRPHSQRALLQEIEPVRQVAARGEITGPGGLRVGIDVRGDGSTEAFRGRIARRVVPAGDGEDAFAVLRRLASVQP